MTNMNNSSYKNYITSGLETLSKNFTVKEYKLASQEEWRGFERGSDVRVQIQWKGVCIWEWILEKTFWIQGNTNKEDRVYMRKHADVKLDACKCAIIKKKPNKVSKIKTKTKVGNTQELFNNIQRTKS